MSKRPKPQEIIAKLQQADVFTSRGRTMGEVGRAIGVTEVTYYHWRQEYGGLKSDQIHRMKESELCPRDRHKTISFKLPGERTTGH